jgi:hypothetical protein
MNEICLKQKACTDIGGPDVAAGFQVSGRQIGPFCQVDSAVNYKYVTAGISKYLQ